MVSASIAGLGDSATVVRRSVGLLVPIVVGIVAFALARNALLPGAAFWDTGEFQTVGPLLGTAHPTGFPSYVILGWLASVVLQPFGEPAFRMNLLSAILLGTAAALTAALIRDLTRSAALGVAGGLGLAMTPIAWKLGTHADPHVLHLALVALLLVLLVGWEHDRRGLPGGHDRRDGRDGRDRPDEGGGPDEGKSPDEGGGPRDRRLVAAAAIFGVSLANHTLTVLLAPGIALFVLAVDPSIWRRARLIAVCGAVLVGITLLLYLELPLRAGPFRAPLVYGTPDTWDGFRYIVLAEQFRGGIIDPLGDLPRKLGDLQAIAGAQFGPLTLFIPLGLLATVVLAPRYALLSGLGVLVTCLFNAAYTNADINRYYLGPALIAWTWLALLGAGAVRFLAALLADPDADGEGWTTSRGPSRGGPTWGLVTLAMAAALLAPSAIAAPERSREAADQVAALGAEGWTTAALGALERDSVVISWWSYSTPLWYAQLVEGQRPDIEIVDDRTRLDRHMGEVTDVIAANLGKKPVYVIRIDSTELATIERRYPLERLPGILGNIQRVLLPSTATR